MQVFLLLVLLLLHQAQYIQIKLAFHSTKQLQHQRTLVLNLWILYFKWTLATPPFQLQIYFLDKQTFFLVINLNSMPKQSNLTGHKFYNNHQSNILDCFLILTLCLLVLGNNFKIAHWSPNLILQGTLVNQLKF